MGLIQKAFKAYGDKKGSEKESKGYKIAGNILKDYGAQAGEISQKADPFQQYRGTYASQLNDILQGKRDFQSDPGYKFAYSEAMRGTAREGAAGGYNYSGNMQASLQNRAAGLASQQYNTIIERLMNLSGAGSQNAIAGGQLYNDVAQTAAIGQADAAIGRFGGRGAGISSLYSGVSNAMSSIAGGNFGGLSSIGSSVMGSTNTSANTGAVDASSIGRGL